MVMPSLSRTSSPVSATIKVHKATSELLVAPDSSMNIDICDYCNSNRGCSKDIMKQIKRRLHHKNSKVQLLTLTLLETMVKNCGDYIHHQISERKILDEMINFVKKKGDVNVRERILSLLDSWQETFGGPGRKHSQYFWAYDELRRLGVHFPPRSERERSVTTSSLSSTTRVSPFDFGNCTLPNSSRRLDEAMTSEVESLSLGSSSTLESMRNVLELLDDMLRAVNPNNRMAVKEELIIDLVERSRTNQKKLMQMITTTTDGDLISKGIKMNDSLQSVLAKHDAIASGAPLPNSSSFKGQESFKTRKGKDKSPISNVQPSSSSTPPPKSHGDEFEEVEVEVEFGQLARRHSKGSSTPSQSAIMGCSDDDASSSCNSNSNSLVLIDAPAPTSTSGSKEQELIDLLSIVVTSSSPSGTPRAPTSATQEALLREHMNNYIVPWTQPQPQEALNPPPQFQNQHQQVQPQFHMSYSQYYTCSYHSPQWEQPNLGSNQIMSQVNMNGCATWTSQNFNSYQGSQHGNQPLFGNALNPSSMKAGMRTFQRAKSVMNHHAMQTQGAQSMKYVDSNTTTATNGFSVNGNPTMNGSTLMRNGSNGVDSGKNKPYISSYQLFEELDLLGSTEGKIKSGPYPKASEKPKQNMVANRRSQINLLD